MTAHFVLVPGFWLGGWAWDAVAADLRAAGARVSQVTLPGLAAAEDDRAAVGRVAQQDALRSAVQGAEAPVVLVAHSGAGSVATAVLSDAPQLVHRVVYVDS